MAATYLEVTWKSYQNIICQGFSNLQHNEEFVDMTLAADGYLTKVHRNILSLSSPYIKAMLKSIDCPNPVIFLNNVTYKILTYILEYIYTGKVHVPSDDLQSFVAACKALKIVGLQDVSPNFICLSDAHLNSNNTVLEKTSEAIQSNFAALITINGENNLDIQKCGDIHTENVANDVDEIINDDNMDISGDQAVNDDQAVDVIPNYDFPLSSHDSDNAGIEMQKQETSGDIGFKLRDIELKPMYTISNRGALQLLMNRYIYSCHHQADSGFKRRWRCVDYRRSRCPAIIDTEGENITARKGLHNHSFHDQKILKKCKKSMVFKSISQAVTTHSEEEKQQ